MQNVNTLILILIVSTIRMATPIILAAIGGVFAARCGVMALGLEGFMLMGAWGAAFGAHLSQNALLGLLLGLTFSLAYSLLFGLFAIKFHVNQVICGIGFNIFASGFTTSMTQVVWGIRMNSTTVPTLSSFTLPVIGELSYLIPITLIIAICSWYYLFKTPYGLRMRFVGENVATANSVGIKVNRYKYIGVGISGLLCGLAGSFLSVDHVDRFVSEMTAGRGFIAVAVNILGRYNPLGVVGGGLLFGFADSLQLVIPSSNIAGQLLQMIPYVVTLFVMVFAVKYVSAPAGVGQVLKD